jgi:AcrR family transcriptional regulator
MGTEQTRARIVTSAARVFAEQGIGPTTVQHLLEAGGVSRRTFYQYFQSKEDVLAAVYESVVGALEQRVAHRISATPDPVQKVTSTVDEWLDVQTEGGAFFVALQAEAVRPDSLLHPRRERAVAALADAIGRGGGRRARRRRRSAGVAGAGRGDRGDRAAPRRRGHPRRPQAPPAGRQRPDVRGDRQRARAPDAPAHGGG